MTSGNVLVVDDEKSQREILKRILESEGYGVELAGNEETALRLCREGGIDLILSDLKMPGSEGLSVLDNLLKLDPNACVIIMTAHGSIDSAVEAMKKGAFDYLTKPIDREALLISIRRAFERINLLRQNRLLQQQLQDRFHLSNVVGNHSRMQEIFRIVHKIASSNATVLISGESGTGKEMIARAVHFNSARRTGPFRAINCAAIPESLIESELFGYEKGAHSTATTRGIGLFEAADRGTLFLDEIGDLSLNMQAKILRTLQEREIRRIGGREEIKIDVRVIAATNKRLEEEIRQGRFREDLYYRLNVISIQLPPLRERATDIPALVDHFIAKYSQQTSKKVRGLTPDALRLLMDYPWPGNVRQLESVVERAVLLCEGELVAQDDLPKEIRIRHDQMDRLNFDIPPEGFSLEAFEKELLLKAMEKSDGVIARAAKLLGISYRTLQYRLEKFGIRKSDGKEHAQESSPAEERLE
ncbi:MAG TPA: sigma-54 dependent transcriptional regulator [Nitrospiria bacterium]|nr:sigma-54 dependent transcriptional regulator [Nitrospiria bacterium]